MENEYKNPLGYLPVPRLLFKMALPAVIANLVNALYNIVDQIFIGNIIGFRGNAVTNVAFPLTTVCLAIGLMTGLGGAAAFNLELGRKNEKDAGKYVGASFSFLLLAGVLIAALVRIFVTPVMTAFGATPDILEYAVTYASVTSLGIPFLMFCVGSNALVRGDGASTYAMASLICGALINVGLDALFMHVFKWGMFGAALATVIGQFISACMLALYIRRFKSVTLSKDDFIPRPRYLSRIWKLGLSSFIFQGSMVIVQVTLNNLLRKYGALSVYGSEITIAAAGIVTKICSVFIAAVIGMVQGGQPIFSFNYGAQNFTRVRKTLKLLLTVTTTLAVIIWAFFQIKTRWLIGLFGGGSDLYFEFAVTYARVYTRVMFVHGIQIAASTFFPAIGKAGKGALISLSKQLLIFMPTLLILSHYLGLDGIMITTPICDVASFILATVLLHLEMKQMPKE
ncbi:MAG: MATE family efflux transporter [Clostridia bacterium]|nr:MATE family efflux transporter [Clostridia bacterium]